MKLRVTQSGMQSYSGLLADVWFVDGVSATDVNEQQLAYVKSLFECEAITDEQNNAEQEGEVVEQEGEVVELGGKAVSTVGEPEPQNEIETEGGNQ